MSKTTPSHDWRTMSDEDFAKTKPAHIPKVEGHTPPERIGSPVAKRKPQGHRKRTPTQTLLSQSAYHETLPKGERGRLVIDRLPEGWPEGVPLPDNVVWKSNRNNQKFYQRPDKGQNLTKGNIMASINDTLKRKAGQKLTEWILAIAMIVWRKIRDIVIDNFLSFGIYRKDSEGKPVPKLVPMRDDDGAVVLNPDGTPVMVQAVDSKGRPKYEIAWGATLLSVLAKWRGEIAFLGAALGYQIGGATVFEWLERLVNLFGV